MTDQPQPPPYDDATHPHVVQQLAVPTKAGRVPRPGGLAVIVLAIVVAMLAGWVAVLLIDARRGAGERHQLACEVQRLGGRAIGQVDCPQPSPSATPSRRPSPRPSSPPAVTPKALPGPAGPRGPRGPAAVAPAPRSPAPTAGASRPPSSPAARPSPTPSCRRPNPLPAGPRCVLPRGAQRT